MPQRATPSKQADPKAPAVAKRPAPSLVDQHDRPAGQAAPTASRQNLLSLQRRFGNRAVVGLVQPKLEVGPADDAYERQADQMARQVSRGAPLGAPTPGPNGGGQMLLRASTQATRSAAGLVQRKSALVSAKTTARRVTTPLGGDTKQNLATLAAAPKGFAFQQLQPIEVADNQAAHVKDPSGAIAWFKIQSGNGAGQYIRGTKVIGGLDAGQTPPKQEGTQGQQVSGLDTAGMVMGGTDAALIEIYRGATMENAGDRTQSLAGLSANYGAQQQLEFAEGGTWIASGILGMAASVRDLADKDKSWFDKLLAGVGLASGAASVAGGVSQIVQYANYDTATAAAGGTQSSTYTSGAISGGFMVGFGDLFSTLTSGLKTIKNIVDLVRMVASDKKFDTGDGLKLGTDIITNGLQTAYSLLRTIRGFNEVLNHGQTATMQFGSVLPGLDIAMSAIGIIQNGYYLGVSAAQMVQMRRRKLELELQLQSEHGLTQAQVKAAGKRYRTEEAQDATTDQLIAETTAAYNKLSAKKFRAKNAEERSAIEVKQALVMTELNKLKVQKAAQDANKAGGTFVGYQGPAADVLRERELASNTHVANKRRVTRQGVHIGTRLVQIAGAIATFVSGPGAPAAMALKLSALGIDASLPFWRWIKEKGRDAAAANRAKGEDGFTNKLFNADKSAAAKGRYRHKDAVLILQMVGRLSENIPIATDTQAEQRRKLAQIRPQSVRVEGYIRAAGCDPEKLYAANGKPADQVKILVAELARREL